MVTSLLEIVNSIALSGGKLSSEERYIMPYNPCFLSGVRNEDCPQENDNCDCIDCPSDCYCTDCNEGYEN